MHRSISPSLNYSGVLYLSDSCSSTLKSSFFHQNSRQEGVSTSLAGYDIDALPMAMGEMASSFRNRELEWRRTHPEILKSFENQWVVLEGEEIIAHGRNPIEVVAKARAEGN